MQILTWRKLSGSCRIRDCHTLYTFHNFYTFHTSYTSRKFSVNPAAVFVDYPAAAAAAWCSAFDACMLVHALCMDPTWTQQKHVNLGKCLGS